MNARQRHGWTDREWRVEVRRARASATLVDNPPAAEILAIDSASHYMDAIRAKSPNNIKKELYSDAVEAFMLLWKLETLVNQGSADATKKAGHS